MISATSSFIDALRFGSYLIASRITVYSGGQPTSIVLPVSDATFTVDRNSEQRRQGQMTVEILPEVPPVTASVGGAAQILLPLNPQSILAPFGNEIFVEFTLVGNGGNLGDNGWVPMGMYSIATSVIQDSGIDLTCTLDLYDRSWAIAQRSLTTAYSVPAGAGDLQTEITLLLATALGGGSFPWTFNFQGGSTYTVPAGTYNQGQDPWQACLDMATSAGYELYFDVLGNLVAQPVPDPTQANVVWNFSPGEVQADGSLAHPLGGTPFTTPIGIELGLTRDGIANSFYVTPSGSNNANPTQAVAQDTTAWPISPTSIYGPMGVVPHFVYDSNITTTAQALAEAQYDLAKGLAKAWTLGVATPPNPLFDIDDVCTATWPRLGLDTQKFVVDQITTSVRYDVNTMVKGRVIW